MVFQNDVCTAVIDLDEGYVIGTDDKDFDIVLNPKNFKNDDGYAAVCVTAKTEKTVKIAVICEYSTEFSAMLNGYDLYLTVNGDAMRFDLKDGALLYYEIDAVKDEFDFSELDKLL